MDWLGRVNEALQYIEENLAGEIDFNIAAQKACCSVYHFQRLFSFITEVPLSEYIRRRRLTLAACELRGQRVKIIDLAMKYGYDSPISFSRAFQKLHGVTPTLARDAEVALKAYPKISFYISLKGEQEMNYKIVERAAWTVAGKSVKASMVNGKHLELIPRFWTECKQDGTICDLVGHSRGKLGGKILGICTSYPSPQEFTYMIAAEAESGGALADMETFNIPALTWAVFECVGPMPQAMQEMLKRVYVEFFPSSGYERAEGPDVEVYPEGDLTSPNYHSELWLPVVRK